MLKIFLKKKWQFLFDYLDDDDGVDHGQWRCCKQMIAGTANAALQKVRGSEEARSINNCHHHYSTAARSINYSHHHSTAIIIDYFHHIPCQIQNSFFSPCVTKSLPQRAHGKLLKTNPICTLTKQKHNRWTYLKVQPLFVNLCC